MKSTTSPTIHSKTSFGMIMSERSFSSEKYRFSYNGKEKDSETGNQDYGMRVYNPALGRFLSVDPLRQRFASIRRAFQGR